MIGGIFPVFNKDVSSVATFDGEPPAVTCALFDLRAFRWAQMMIFAIEEVNTDPALLPNISLGYKILNSCSSPTNTLRAALTLASSQNEKETASGCSPPISTVIAEAGSSQSLAVAGILGPFQVAVVSYFSTCACLSNRVKYPTFFRTIPSDYFQAKALAALVKHFGWEWIGAIQSDNDYGRNGVLAFAEEVKKLKICIAFIGTVLRTYPQEKILKVVEMIKQSTVKVILAFTPEGDFYPLMKEIVKQNITGIQWIASEAWITAARPSTPEMYRAFGGALGFVVQKMDIPNLNPFLMNINPYRNPSEPFVKDFWEIMVGCKPSSNASDTGAAKICLGNETLMDYTQDVFFNVSQLRVAYNVYKAVYTIAHALHQLVFCRPAAGGKNVKPCLNVSEIHPREVTYHLQRVNFRNRFGDDVFFDENGNPPASYDVINWQLRNGQVQHVTLGHFTSTKNGEFTLSIQEDRIVWRTGQMVPASVCSNACPAGTRKAQIKGKPVCCFDCVPCAEGSIANSTGATECTACPQDYWSNERKDGCIPKTIEFLAYHEPMGVALTAVALLGASLSLLTMVVFIHYRETPVIKASNSELSCFLLFSLFLCFLCPLTFIGRPTVWTCMLRHTAFGVTFALCISCVLGKTIVVVTAFKVVHPNNKPAVGQFGPIQQRIIVCSCTLVQVIICILWLKLNPPFPDRVFKYSSKKIVLECNTGSEVAFYAVLGYIGILSVICLILAFLARKLPDNFNEAKCITFSMLIFCAVWITFIPAYVSSPGKFTVAVEIFAILSSAFGLLISIFAPKCYIILVKPEKNTKKYVMRLNASRKYSLERKYQIHNVFTIPVYE
ncbi:extracellular calcium-sensing receptor-like [Poecilia latipinna]|uniref:extracellular calcium-sensing receptor-like n=1 Tax=Poecilia latipinna TaxID=48699 RepID=UPI00072E3A61|nr:PREDICTED: extracellular calcium-sensing receptor-like [Poecilia latipinna]